jgi:CheY-like chemotaxis protein
MATAASLTVLVVEANEDELTEFGAWLEDAGYEVVTCPGPSAPDYTCIGGRFGECPLIGRADVIVLDLAILGEEMMQGTSAEELLGTYVIAEIPVVALGSWRRSPDPVEGERVMLVCRHPDRDTLLRAVGRLAEPTSLVGG